MHANTPPGLCRGSAKSPASIESGVLRGLTVEENVIPMSTVQEIGEAIGTLPWLERLKLYSDPPDLIGRKPENLDWQQAGLEKFFTDDSPDDAVYDQL